MAKRPTNCRHRQTEYRFGRWRLNGGPWQWTKRFYVRCPRCRLSWDLNVMEDHRIPWPAEDPVFPWDVEGDRAST